MQRHIEQDKNLKRSAGSQIGKGRDVGCGTLRSFVTSCGVLWSIVASCGVLWHLACPNNRSACRLAAGLVTPKVLTAKQVFYLKWYHLFVCGYQTCRTISSWIVFLYNCTVFDHDLDHYHQQRPRDQNPEYCVWYYWVPYHLKMFLFVVLCQNKMKLILL